MDGSQYFVAWPKPSFDIFILFRYFSSNREKNLIWKSNSPILAVQFQCFHLCISWLEYRIQGSRFPVGPRPSHRFQIYFKSQWSLLEIQSTVLYFVPSVQLFVVVALKTGKYIPRKYVLFRAFQFLSKFWRSIDFSSFHLSEFSPFGKIWKSAKWTNNVNNAHR